MTSNDTSEARGDLLRALCASHARYKAKCARVAELERENAHLRTEVRQWKTLMLLHSDIISLTEQIIKQEVQR
jgi:hypothetical protein